MHFKGFFPGSVAHVVLRIFLPFSILPPFGFVDGGFARVRFRWELPLLHILHGLCVCAIASVFSPTSCQGLDLDCFISFCMWTVPGIQVSERASEQTKAVFAFLAFMSHSHRSRLFLFTKRGTERDRGNTKKAKKWKL